MARRLSFSIAQPITIVGWYIASVLLIAIIWATKDGLKIAFNQVRGPTRAYYYAIIAAVVYFVTVTLMVFTVYGASRGDYLKEFKLKMSQRTLMLQTIAYMVYLLGGAAAYAKVDG